MFKSKSIVFIALLYFILSSCEEDYDYRDSVIGTYEFVTIHSQISMCYEPSEDCINGWYTFSDTINYISEVKAYGTNQLKIKFGDGIIGNFEDGEQITYTLYPIYEDENLVFDDYPIGSRTGFNGKIVNDRISVNISYGFFMGGFETYNVTGVKL